MKTAAKFSFLLLMISSIWQGFLPKMPTIFDFFLLAPLTIVFSLQYFRFKESLMICLLSGAIIDILSGSIIGFNIFLMILFVLILSFFNVFLGKKSQFVLSFYVLIISFFYRIIYLIFQGLFGNTYLMLGNLIFGPIIDSIISILFYYLLSKIQNIFRLSGSKI